MSKANLTSEQKRCLALDRSLRITAGAGSGKTRVLVERYLKMLFETDIEVENVLALTFTKKAASEMLERALSEINKRRVASPPSGAEQERWERLFEDLSQARIATIHSFCESLMREFPLEAGVDPDFQVMEDVDAGILLDESLNRTLFEIARDDQCPEYRALDRLLTIYARWELNDLLKFLLRARHNRKAREQLLGAVDVENALKFHSIRITETNELKRNMMQPFIENMKFGFQVFKGYHPKSEDDKAYEVVRGTGEYIDIMIDNLKSGDIDGVIAAVAELKELAYTKNGTPRKLNGKKGNWDPGELDRLKDDWNKFSEVMSELPEISEHDAANTEVLYLIGIVYSRVLKDFEKTKGNGRLLDFDDLIEYTDRLLQNAEQAIRKRIYNRFRFIMVDEFQDTDPKQWKIIRSLAGPGRDVTQGKFCVLGDAKQSIYGFRDADVRVISSPEVTATCKREENLGINFRSLPALVDFQNYFFPQLMGESRSEFEVDYGPPMKSGRETDTLANNPQGHLAMLMVEPESDYLEDSGPEEDSADSPGKSELIEAEADLIAFTIAKITAPEKGPRIFVERDFDGNEINDYIRAQPGHIGILLRRRTNLQVYEEELRKHNIPFIVYGGIGFFQRQEILDIYNLLSFLANPRDDIALTGVLRSPLFELPDEAIYEISRNTDGSLWERLKRYKSDKPLNEHDHRAVNRASALLERWLDISGRASAVELIRTVIDDTGFTGVLGTGVEGDLARANIEKLLDIIRSFERSSATWGSDLHGLVARLQELCSSHDKEGLAQLELEKSNAVKIMTIHAAKGLEFPVVFIPDLNRSFSGSNFGFGENLVNADVDYGIGLAVPVMNDKKKDTLFSLIKNRKKEADLAEEKRLLYVAATRARDALFFVGHQEDKINSKPKCWWNWLMKYMGIESVEDLHSDKINFIAPAFDDETPARERTIHIVSSSMAAAAKAELGESTNLTPSDDVKITLVPSPAEMVEKITEDMRFVHEDRLYHDFPATALMEFDKCPAAFYLNFVAGIGANMLAEETDIVGERRRYASDKARTLGSLTHKAIELQVQALNASGDLAVARKRINERIRMEAAASSVALNEPSLADQAIDHAERFRKSDIFSRIANAAVKRAELPFLFRPSPADEAPARGALRGVIDLLYRIAPDDHTLRIVDYKTVRMDINKRTAESVLAEYRAQLECYAVAAAKIYPENLEIVVASLYLTETGDEVSIALNAHERARIESSIAAKLNEIIELARDGVVPKKFDECEKCAYGRNRLCSPGSKLPIDALLRSRARPVVYTE